MCYLHRLCELWFERSPHARPFVVYKWQHGGGCRSLWDVISQTCSLRSSVPLTATGRICSKQSRQLTFSVALPLQVLCTWCCVILGGFTSRLFWGCFGFVSVCRQPLIHRNKRCVGWAFRLGYFVLRMSLIYVCFHLLCRPYFNGWERSI